MLARLQRLLGVDGNCFDVAIDHGIFNEPTFLGGIEDMGRAVAAIVAAGPDAIQLTPGQAPLLQAVPGRTKPALVLRTDVANCYGKTLPRHLFSHLVDDAVEQAVRLDAAAVVVNLLLLQDEPELHERCIENVGRLRADCTRYGMPLMVEPLAMAPNSAGGYMVDGDAEKIVPLVRQAVELGADLIKADPTDDPADFARVVTVAAGRPVLVRGGGKASEAEILRRTHALMQTGARGIVYGRNVIQHPNPTGMTRAFMAIVHEGATPEQALTFL
ncbi:MAG TPA: aldolase [Candidatus Binatia bacterium]|jgi:DhnA family fructose-bisphosphate aldolase class Ia|nr:aldolase [Candidatus Binatia bacterium]